MTVRIIRDVEEAIAREVRRITFHEDRSKTHTVLRDTFDPFTGEKISLPVEPDFYDSSADTKHIQYPHFFIKLLRSREDRYTGRVVPPYGKGCLTPVTTSPKAYEIVFYFNDGQIASAGSDITTSSFKIAKVQVGYLLRVLSGNNQGTYKVSNVVKSATGDHTITVSGDLVEDLPELTFDSDTRTVTFLEPLDLSTVKAGDTFEDASAATFSITSIDVDTSSIVIGGVATPDTSDGGKITRSGNVFQTADVGFVVFTVMDPSKPAQRVNEQSYTQNQLTDPPIPIDLYYLVRIDSKEKDTHVDVATRMWEEFNPPRSALPTVVRSKNSAEQLLTSDVSAGGSDTIEVSDNSKFSINDPVYIFNDLTPTKSTDGSFESIFESQVKELIGTTQIKLKAVVPDTFTIAKNSKIVSNAEYRTFMFHFVDHVTKDVEGAQYWVHEYTFWTQVWVDRLGEPAEFDGVVQDITVSGEDIDGNVIIEC